MNCKPGELARIVCPQRAVSELRDRIVRVTVPCDIGGEPGWVLEKRESFVMLGCARSTLTGEKFWIGTPSYVDRLQDKYLRPIRGGEGDDETLAWAGRPASADPVHKIIAEEAGTSTSPSGRATSSTPGNPVGSGLCGRSLPGTYSWRSTSPHASPRRIVVTPRLLASVRWETLRD